MIMTWTDEEIACLYNEYEYGRTQDLFISQYRKPYSIHAKAKSLGLKKKCKTNIKYDFFRQWSSDMAYILGFIICDGCIVKKHKKDAKVLKIAVSEKDTCVLDYIKSHIKPDCRTTKYKSTKCKEESWIDCISFYSKDLINDLERLGVTERKTGKEILPDCPDEFRYDLLRGIIDGDGSIFVTNNRPTIHIASASEKFIDDIRIKLLGGFGYKYSCKTSGTLPMYNISVNKKREIELLAKKLYLPDYCFCLERKRSKLIEAGIL